jgi:hypothetical protein
MLLFKSRGHLYARECCSLPTVTDLSSSFGNLKRHGSVSSSYWETTCCRTKFCQRRMNPFDLLANSLINAYRPFSKDRLHARILHANPTSNLSPSDVALVTLDGVSVKGARQNVAPERV